MLTARRATRPAAALALVVLAVLALAPAAASAQDRSLEARLDAALRPLSALSRTGVLVDRVLPLARLDRLDGGENAPAIDAATWRQAYDELRRASLGPPAGPALAAIDAGTRASLREGVIPLAILDREVERVRPGALEDGSLRIVGDALEPTGASPLLRSRVFAAAALAPHTFRGADAVFSLAPDRLFADASATPRSIEVDFADGRSFRPVVPGERVRVRYGETGRHTLRARLTRADGAVAESRFTFDVAALVAPTPDDTLHVTATIPYQAQLGTGDAYVYLAPGHAQLVNPVVVVEGFDLDNSMNWDELYALLNQQSLLETLRADGFDAVVLNFTDATDAIQKNAFVVAELIQQVQAAVAPATTLAIVGASMGGLCSRYALAYLESHAIPHRVRTWISFDAPQAGANIPLGVQYWINFFAGQSADAAAFLAVLQRPAARQMLLYHLTTPAGTTGQPDPMRAGLLSDLAAVGGYPALPRLVAIANGSGTAANQGFLPGAQLIRWEYSSPFVAITGNVWAVPNATSTTIFRGSLRILISTTSQTVTVNGTLPWDGAPGGSRASLAELDAVAAPYGDIVALHPSHAFIPTVSALALATGDPFFDVSTAPDPLALTPFDAIYWPTANEEHVLLTPENAAWVRSEIEQGVLAADGPPAPREDVELAATPNPASGGPTRLTFTLPRDESVDLRVFAVDGREVRALGGGPFPAGRHTVAWDGLDGAGRAAPPGVYFALLRAPGATRTTRFARFR